MVTRARECISLAVAWIETNWDRVRRISEVVNRKTVIFFADEGVAVRYLNDVGLSLDLAHSRRVCWISNVDHRDTGAVDHISVMTRNRNPVAAAIIMPDAHRFRGV